MIVEETSRGRVVGWITIPETVREDLVDDPALKPFRDAEGGVVDSKLI